MKINWKVRIVNKAFWTALIPMLLLLAQLVLDLFGVTIDLGEIGNKVLAIVDTLFGILALIGITNDPTTKGLDDSDRAMTYTEPN